VAWWERVPTLALVLAIVLVGIYPAVVMDLFERGVLPIASRLG
jgi:NADH:ubiquinone oxidoreductase subunit 4 (subunit M)